MTQPSIDSIAPISRRAIAYLIDALISGAIGAVGFVVVAIVAFLPRPTEELLVVMPIAYGVLLLLLLGWFVFYTVMQTRGGSIGMRAQRLRLASAADGAPIGFGRALLRNVVFGLSTAIVVGYFTPLFDGSGRFQGWHDKVGNAVVVDAKKSPSPIRRTDAGAAAAAAPGAAAPVQTAPVGAPPVPLLPPAPLAGGYGAAPVPAPPGFPSAAGAPQGRTPPLRSGSLPPERHRRSPCRRTARLSRCLRFPRTPVRSRRIRRALRNRNLRRSRRLSCSRRTGSSRRRLLSSTRRPSEAPRPRPHRHSVRRLRRHPGPRPHPQAQRTP